MVRAAAISKLPRTHQAALPTRRAGSPADKASGDRGISRETWPRGAQGILGVVVHDRESPPYAAQLAVEPQLPSVESASPERRRHTSPPLPQRVCCAWVRGKLREAAGGIVK